MKTRMNEKEAVKTVTLEAQVAVSKTETGTNIVQVLPDNPCVGQVEAFRGLGYGQMLSTGAFEFTRHKIIRSQAKTLLRLAHSSLSHCKDKTHRFTFIVKDENLEEFSRWLMLEAQQTAAYMCKHFKSYNQKKEAA